MKTSISSKDFEVLTGKLRFYIGGFDRERGAGGPLSEKRNKNPKKPGNS